MLSPSIDNTIHIYLYWPHFWLSGAIAVHRLVATAMSSNPFTGGDGRQEVEL